MADILRKTRRYVQLYEIIYTYHPKTLLEVGTHSGKRSIDMIKIASRFNPNLHYTGYDLWEELTPEVKREERDGKKIVSFKNCQNRFEEYKRQNPNFSYELIKGNTRETLKYPTIADFVFIDGGHSIETIRNDYEAVKDSPIIVFDDYYEQDNEGRCVHDTNQFGCNEIVKTIPNAVILPAKDLIKAGGVIQQVLVLNN